MAAVGPRSEIANGSTMKRPGLTPPLRSATLFLLLGAASWAQEPAKPPPPPAQKSAPPPAMMAPKRMSKEEVLQRFDKNGDGKIDDDERADAHEILMKELIERQMARASFTSSFTPAGSEAFRAY